MALLAMLFVAPASAGSPDGLLSPEKGVLCDRYMCASNKGVSPVQTGKHLGKKAEIKLFLTGAFDRTEFTFANGVFCDVKERLYREGRYFGNDGRQSGTISGKYTRILFPE